jgi:hypothetical protein
MKVAYNNCFGGFGLSPLALTEFAKRKGLTLYWYKSEGYSPTTYTKINGIPKVSLFGNTCFTQDIGDNVTEYPEGSYYYPDFYDDARSDPDLIEVIERLGKKADGACASLAIKEIPDGAQFEITEYDGNEDVVPPRMSW